MTGAQQLTRKVQRQAQAEGRAEGKAEGRAEGKAEVLLKLLRLKFGPLSAQTSARVRKGTPAQFDARTARVLTAESLSAVFRAVRATARRR